jgi:hypothetical protein
MLYLGPDALGTWNAPSAAPVLRAAGQYVDAFITSNNVVLTQTEMDFIESNYGDKPYFGSFYTAANADSALAAYPNTTAGVAFDTQTARGQAYCNMMTAQLQTAHTAKGVKPYIGVYWWEYADNWGEKLNWGLVTHQDDAYDGHENVNQLVECSSPFSHLWCGQEPRSSGNLIKWVIGANRLWFDNL